MGRCGKTPELVNDNVAVFPLATDHQMRRMGKFMFLFFMVSCAKNVFFTPTLMVHQAKARCIFLDNVVQMTDWHRIVLYKTQQAQWAASNINTG